MSREFTVNWGERGIRMAMKNDSKKNITTIYCLGRIALEITPKIDKSMFVPLQKYLANTPCDINSTQRNIEKFLQEKFEKR